MKATNKVGLTIVLFGLISFSIYSTPSESGADSQKSGSDKVINIRSGLQLFIDKYIVDKTSELIRFQMHKPVLKEVVLENNQPWEGSGSGFYSLFQDEGIYRLYYSAWNFTIKPGKVTDDSHPYFLCYAESNDGINWRKPELNLVEFQGSKKNNIVMSSDKLGDVYPDLGHPAVFKDENPNAAPDAKYKALIRDYSPETGVKGMLAFKSPDGIHWQLMHPTSVITDDPFDSQNIAFWDPAAKIYRAYWRYMRDGHFRSIRTATSNDFIHWENRADLSYFDADDEQLYINVIKPYYRAPDLLIGFPIRYVERGWSESMKSLPGYEERLLRASGEERFGTALTESLLMVSRDGVNFKRRAEAFLRPEIERPGSWSYGDQYMAWSIVETESHIKGAPHEISLYAVEGNWGTLKKDMNALRRYTLRLDGFVSVNAPMSGGEMITKPLSFEGNKLLLNFSSSAAGEIKVELQDINGNPVPGYTLADCEPVFGDTIERPVYWKGSSDVAKLKGNAIRIRFVMNDAEIYSFKFQ